MNTPYCPLTNRGVLQLKGPDRLPFLQGLITNDIYKLSPTQSLYTALLTPQGKFLFDFFICQHQDSLLIDCELDRLPPLKERLQKFKLRSDITLTDISSDWLTMAFFSPLGLPKIPGTTEVLPTGGLRYLDPRLADLGCRLLIPKSVSLFEVISQEMQLVPKETYDQKCLRLGVPDGSRDMLVEKAIPLECNLDALNAIDWDKGCYMGQELTSRTKHRGLVRKRLLPVRFEGDTLPFMAPLFLEDREVGSMRTSSGGFGLALIRLEVCEHRLYTKEPKIEVTPEAPAYKLSA